MPLAARKMMCGVPATPNYVKPFHLFPHNKPKSLPEKRIKQPDFRIPPQIPVRLNYATKMRNKIIKEFNVLDCDEVPDYRKLSEKVMEQNLPPLPPAHTRTSQFRYKWTRDVPVVSCKFVEHVMMYNKPPFTYEGMKETCARFKLKKMKLKDLEKSCIEYSRIV